MRRSPGLVAGLVVLASASAGESIAADVKFVFSNPPVLTDRGVPDEARDAGTVPDPGGPPGPRSNIRFRIVPDLKDYGALSNVVAARISKINVTWFDASVLGTSRATEDFLRRLLASTAGSTVTFIPWAQMLGPPTIAATVEHGKGHDGRWLVWYAWPAIYFAYRDGTGTWWFGNWLSDADLRLR